MFARKTTWADILRQVQEEGEKAARDGYEIFDNPYSFIREGACACAWEKGFKSAAR